MPPTEPCGNHAGFERLLLGAVEGVKELFISKFTDLETNLNRRLDESAKDRSMLHEKHNELAREVSRATARLNGASLVGYAPKQDRKTDTFKGKLAEDWKLYLLVAALAAVAGTEVKSLIYALLGIK